MIGGEIGIGTVKEIVDETENVNVLNVKGKETEEIGTGGTVTEEIGTESRSERSCPGRILRKHGFAKDVRSCDHNTSAFKWKRNTALLLVKERTRKRSLTRSEPSAKRTLLSTQNTRHLNPWAYSAYVVDNIFDIYSCIQATL
mmetsp:Transcript_7398/g.11849  ORF Transcript_7398/g.11849 Transcript_7398/m.11849 type:complete len:143 (-) Transcript_7398:223-651(-)